MATKVGGRTALRAIGEPQKLAVRMVALAGQLVGSGVFGQTCDGLDVISQSEELPNLEIEDLVYSTNIGAYSNASATWFNGFPPAPVVHVNV
jgi:diaminopimelate decarboxylase